MAGKSKQPLRYIFISGLLCCSIFIYTLAQTKEELQARITAAEEEIRISTELLEKTRQNQRTSESQLKLIQSRITNRRSLVRSMESRLSLIESDISSKSRSVTDLDTELVGLKKDYARMVYAAYKNYKLNNFMLFLFSSEDFNDATRRIDFMRRYNRMRQDKAQTIAVLTDSINNEITELARTRTDLDNTRTTQGREIESLGRDESQYKSSMDQLKKEETQLTQQVKDKQAEIERAERQIQALIAAEVNRARTAVTTDAENMEIIALSGRFEENKGRLPYPINGVIIDRFGRHAHQIVSSTRVDNPGINIAADAGAQVRCVFDGTVSGVFQIPVYNTCILVRHGNFITVYANLTSVSIKQNDILATGQTIGRINDSNDPDAHFLHFEIRHETESLNPEEWLRR